MKWGRLLILFSLIVILVLFWNHTESTGKPETAAEKLSRQYVEAYGYQVWSLMPIDPAPYMGKQIEVHNLTVTQHPFDSYPDSLGS